MFYECKTSSEIYEYICQYYALYQKLPSTFDDFVIFMRHNRPKCICIIEYPQGRPHELTATAHFIKIYGYYPECDVLNVTINLINQTNELPSQDDIEWYYAQEHNAHNPTCNLEKLIRYKLPHDWNNIKNNVDADDTCTLCCDTFKSGDVVSQIPCGGKTSHGVPKEHMFHNNRKCSILKWLSVRNTCPNCKTHITIK